MSAGETAETLGHLLHGTARAWRQKLDQRLKPMGLSQAKWRTLMHLSIAQEALTQAEIAARLGVEEPTVVTLLHRLEREAWITRTNSSHDRRCKMVLLGRRAQRVIAQINATAEKLRHELLADIAQIRSPNLHESAGAHSRASRERRPTRVQRAAAFRSRFVRAQRPDQTARSIPKRRAHSWRNGGFK